MTELWTHKRSRTGNSPTTSLLFIFTIVLLLQACGGGGSSTSDNSNNSTAIDVEAPATPTNISAVASSSTRIDLSWVASTDNGGGVVAGYRIYRNGDLTPIATVTGTSYADTGLSSSTLYDYAVTAFDDASPSNESAPSSASATTGIDTLAPGIPPNLTAVSVSSSQINLSWSASTDNGGGSVAGYTIYRNGNLTPIATVTGTSYVDQGLTTVTLYSYAVKAFDNANPAHVSAPASASATTLVDISAPDAPANVTATANSSTQITLNWDASIDHGGGFVAGYRIYRDGNSTPIATVPGTNTSYVDSGLAPATHYNYTVTAVDNAAPANESTPGAASGTTSGDITPPNMPPSLTATVVSSTQINLSWNASTDNGGGSVAGYYVYRNGLPTPIATLPSTVTNYSNTGLNAATSYSYAVSAYDDATPANESAAAATSATTSNDTTAPNAPTNLTATAVNSSRIDLDWDAVTDNGGGTVTGYRIYRDGNPSPIITVTSTSYSDTGLSAATLYSYSVTAIDDATPTNESAAASASTTTPITYNFNSGNASGWLNVNDSGIPSTWQVISGEYNQGADVGDSSFGNVYVDGSYHVGSFSYVPTLLSLSDYHVSVDITPLPDPPPRDIFGGKDVGLMFRYQNNSNYYRVSFNARNSYTRLEKKVGNVFTTLATNARGYVDGQTYTVEVNLSGDLIQVTLDGDPLFAVRDTSLSSGSIGLYTQDAVKFDNVVIDASDPAPTVVVSQPLAHSVQTGNALTTSATVTNLPAGGSVSFEFSGLPCSAAIQSFPGFYTANCGSPVQGDYYLPGQGLRAQVHNSSGGVVASDENSRVGIAGDYYVSIGDSITAGTYDFYTTDNISADGRIIGQQGYQAWLSDRLTATTGHPNIVFNEGVGGDETTDTLGRINSILGRHPGSNRMLMMLGTNDSGGGTPLSQSAFQANMQSLVNTMKAQGNLVWVAKLLPVMPYAANTTRNNDIQGYNTAINNLSGIQPGGPDFFAFFYDNNGTPGNSNDDYERSSMYYNNLHPNSLGLHIMGELWHNTITSSSTVPFYLDRLCNRLVSSNCTAVSPTNHKQNLLQVSNLYYLDEPYTLTSIPAALLPVPSQSKFPIWIQTANLERTNNSASYINFTVDRPVTVYVAYDAGASALPNWLRTSSGYTNTGLNIQTTDPASPSLRLYSRNFSAGAVALGGNLASGASGADSNYIVIVKEQ